MSRLDLMELWTRHLDGAALENDDRQRLVDGLERDDALRSVVLDDWAIDGLLRAQVLEAESSQRFTAGVATLIAAGSDNGRFAAQIQQRLGRTGRWRIGRTRRRWHSTVAAAAAVLVLILAWHWQPTRVAPVTTQDMQADLPTSALDQRRLVIGTILRPTTPLSLTWDDGTRAEVAPGATLTIGDPQRGKLLTLTSGSLRVDAQPQNAEQPLRITTVQAQAIVVGTAFTLRADAAQTRLIVDHGLVRLHSEAHGERAVGAGQSLTADRFGLRAPGQPVFVWDATSSDNPAPVLGKLTTAPDGRACLKAEHDLETTPVVAVTFNTPGAWCAYDPRTVVTCRVWLGNTVKWAGFYVQDYVHHHHGQWHVPLDQRETWREVRFTLGELEGAKTPPPTTGDVLHIVMLQAQFAPGAELFVDRITITPPDSLAP